MWYTRREQPFRYGLWFLGNGMASMLGGLLAYAIGHIESGLAAWRYLFLIFGAITAAWGLVMFFLLPDTPSSTFWLSSTEREMAVRRVTADGQAGVKGTFRVSQVIEALRDPTTWFLSLYTFCVNIANGGLTAFGSLVIQGFGYKGLDALLIQMPAGATQLGFVILSSAFCSWVLNMRTITMIVLTLISLTGMVLMYALDAGNQAGRMAGYCLSLAFSANMPIGLSLITSNVRGFTKRAVVNACVLVMYCVGNIVGPQFFSVSEAPRYKRGITASLVGLGLGVFWVLCLRVYLQWQNKIRSTEDESSVPRESLVMEDPTDWNIPGCQYVL
jgi:MFS family permease